MSDNKKLLKDFATELSVPVYYTDGVKYPFKSGGVIKPVVADLGKFYLELFDRVEEKIAPNEWNRVFDNAQQLCRCVHHTINGMKALELPEEEIAQYMLRIAKAILVLQNGHYFPHYSQYIVLDNIEIQKEVSFHTKELLFLATALWAYSETLYFVHRQQACQYHGGYDLGDGTFAIVRDFCNLKPKDLWEEFDFIGISDTIRIVTVHDNSLKIDFDSYNNLYLRDGNMLQTLKYGYVIVDGKAINQEQTSKLFGLIQNKLNAFHKIIEGYPGNRVKHKYIDIFWYRTKPMADFLGVDWKPGNEIHEKADIYFNTEPPPAPKKEQTFEEFVSQYDYSEYI